MTEFDPKKLALAQFLDVEPSTIETTYSDDTFKSTEERGEYRVLTDDEANQAWDEYLDSYVDEWVPEHFAPYFDRAKWKRDARHDGRGHCLSPWDGEEHEVRVDGHFFYVYRTN